MEATTVQTFIWDKSYDNVEQVRPYLADFIPLHDEFERAHGTAYNSLFKGRIPGMAGSPNEDTGIYLLQHLLDLDRLRERTQAFLDSGGYRLTDRLPEPNERGTLVHTGYYMGGTGWSKVDHVKVNVENEAVKFKAPRQRNWRTHYDSVRNYLFMPDERGGA